MGGRGNWISYAAAIVVGVVVTYFAGPQAGYMAGMLVLGVGSAISSKKKEGGFQNAAAKDVDIASATEAIVVPVGFGRWQMSGNYMRYDTDSFRSEAIPAEGASGGKGGGGGGGGGDQISGFRYYLSYLYGLCMGEIDAVGKIVDGSEMKTISTGLTWFAGDSITKTISGADMGGEVVIFRGNDTQTPAEIGGPAKAATHLNYHFTAYAWLENFYIGQSPTPKTLLFEIIRRPRCLDDAGVPVPGLITTGSNDDTGRCWLDANPAAIIYEILTNKVWGRAFSTECIDIPSFVAASQFFADSDIGLSMSIDQQGKLGDIVEFIQRHVNSAVVWDGEKVRFVVLMNPNDSTKPVDLTAEDVTDVVQIAPAWPECANELRVEFLNAENSYKTEIAQAQDDGAIAAIGGQINSQQVTLNGFTNRYTAEAQTLRLLNELSYPQKKLSCKVSATGRRLYPGQRVRFVWDEIGTQPINSYWRVIEFSDRNQDADGIQLDLAEDLYAQTYLGAKQAFAPVPPAFTNNSFASNDDLTLAGNQNDPYDPGTMEPAAFELNIFQAVGTRQFAVLTEQGSGANTAAVHSWRTGAAPFTTFASTKGWAITGELLSDVPLTAVDIQRGTGGMTFDFALNNAANEAAMLSSANKVLSDSDDITTLTGGLTDALIIGGEMFLVGKIEEVSAGVFRASNFIRGFQGTGQTAHTTGDAVAFIPSWTPTSYVVSQGDIPTGEPVDFQTNVQSPTGDIFATEFPWEGPAAGEFIGLGLVPFLPGYLSHTKTVDSWYGELRPRIHAGGFGFLSNLADDLGNLTTALPSGYGVLVQPFLSGTPTADRVGVIANFIPDDGTTTAAGRWNFTYNAPAGSNELRVWSVYKGTPSLDYISLTP